MSELQRNEGDLEVRAKDLWRIAINAQEPGDRSDMRGLAALALAKYAAELEAAVLELKFKNETDHLTKVKTRATILQSVNMELARTLRSNRPTAVLMIDIDHFKKVNDTFGHDAGDEVLRKVGELLSEMMRPTDSVGRLGGEEFLVVLSDANEAVALQYAERIRAEIEATVGVTVSVGVIATRGTQTADRMTKAADAAMYKAKNTGRNKVVLSSDRL